MAKFCTWVDIQDLITYATFGNDRLRGLGVARGRISRFPIDLRRRPYNTRALYRASVWYATEAHEAECKPADNPSICHR